MPSKRRQGPPPKARRAQPRQVGRAKAPRGREPSADERERTAANDIWGVVVAVVALWLLVSLVVPTQAVLTAAMADGLVALFGRGAALVPIALLVFAATFFIDSEGPISGRVALGLALVVLAVLSLVSLDLTGAQEDPLLVLDRNVVGDAGGYVGGAVAWLLLTYVGRAAGNVILVGVAVCGAVVCGFSITGAVARLRAGAAEAAHEAQGRREERRAQRAALLDARPQPVPWEGPAAGTAEPETSYLGDRKTSVLVRDQGQPGRPGATASSHGQAPADGTAPARTAARAGAGAAASAVGTDAVASPSAAADPDDPFSLPISGLGVGPERDGGPSDAARGSDAPGGEGEPARGSDAPGGEGDAAEPPTGKLPARRHPQREPRARRPVQAPLVAAGAGEPDEDGYRLPPLSMLKSSPVVRQSAASAQELRETMQRLQTTLNQFGLSSRVVDYVSGPLVTTFRVEMGEGERVSKVVNLSDDIALTLAAESVRIMPHIPGTSLVGIEIPNAERQNVFLGDVIPYAKGGPLEVAVGRDADGTPIVADIATMPHLLVAGSTGSGKSVMINSMIMTLLMRTTPKQVRLILVDPKRVEFSGYNGLPHLYVPVVTEPRQAASALAWAVSEMERRLKVFERAGARDIRVYNKMCTSGKLSEMDNPPEPMPYLVVIIDELADLMMVAGKDVEASIVRLAQLARAAGIHLILATQRPSADVVTGLIKSNIDNRVALKVSSSIDSRVILDQTGAEKLLGNGDMLFKYRGHSTRRILGCYTSDAEIESVVDFIRAQAEPDYHEEILTAAVPSEAAGTGGGKGADGDDDPLVWEAAQIVVDSQLGSTSGLQRQLSVGYARAGRIMDMLAAKGVVGPPNGSKPREVLLDKEGLEELRQAESDYSGEG